MKTLREVLGAVYRKAFTSLQALTADELAQKDEDGRTPLMHAVLAADADLRVVRLLIERGADVNIADDGQAWTALHFAARDQRAAIVRELLDGGARVDPVDAFGDTPLWRAVMNAGDDLATIKALHHAGADPDFKNHSGSSPMDIARTTGRADIVSLLREGARQGSKSP